LIALLMLLHLVPANPWIILPILVLTCISTGGMILFFGAKKPASTRKFHFYLAAFTCIVLAGGWLLGVII